MSSSPLNSPAVRASVCMASYNGAAFIAEQVESILAQLGPQDELVIVDDASTDGTRDVVRSFADPRIRLIEAAANRGYVRSFERACKASSGACLLLADQDDVWTEGRLELMLTALKQHQVVASNFEVLGGGPRPAIPRLRSGDTNRRAANLLGILVGYRAYYGCGMGFRRGVMEMFLPVPTYLHESHDLWLAVCGNVLGSIGHLDESTLLRRIHAENATPRGWRSLPVILAARVILVRLLVEAGRRRSRVRPATGSQAASPAPRWPCR